MLGISRFFRFLRDQNKGLNPDLKKQFALLSLLISPFLTPLAYSEDENLTRSEPLSSAPTEDGSVTHHYGEHGHNLCERLLAANLEGHYLVEVDVHSGALDLIRLRRIGANPVYRIVRAHFKIPYYGFRHLEIEDQSPDWKADGLSGISPSVSSYDLLSVDAVGRNSLRILLSGNGDPLETTPDYKQNSIGGNILRPDYFTVGVGNTYHPKVIFHRFELTEAVQRLMTPALKSGLAQAEWHGPRSGALSSLLIHVTAPFTLSDAKTFLGRNLEVYPADEGQASPRSNGQRLHYKFSVNLDLRAALLKIQEWAAKWEVHSVDLLSKPPQPQSNAKY